MLVVQADISINLKFYPMEIGGKKILNLIHYFAIFIILMQWLSKWFPNFFGFQCTVSSKKQ